MNIDHFVARTNLPVAVEKAFAWHAREGTIDRLIPPWEGMLVVRRKGGISPGGSVELRGTVGLIPIRWHAEHGPMQPPVEFTDRQVSGPFSLWHHTHRFEPQNQDASVLEDRIDYRIPGGSIGRLLAGRFVQRQLQRMFQYRHATTASDLALHRRTPMSDSMKIAIAGASGLVGSTLAPLLTTGGHTVHRLVRKKPNPSAKEIGWNPTEGRLDPCDLEGIDAVIHLGGENIASGRWTQDKRKRIRDSRVNSTRLLAETLARMSHPPGIFLCASATGIYGDRGEELLTEETGVGKNFLANVCQEWEQVTQPAADAGIRVVNLRFGVVLSPRGGALKQMLPLFRLGLGGRLGSGNQYWSWIGIDDAIGAIYHVLGNSSLSGPVNLTAPEPVTNRQFTTLLAKVLHRPAIFPAPSSALRLALGPMADELLLASARVIPQRLQQTEYQFRNRDLESALRHLLGKHES